jgi:hypothetical protein
LTVAHRFELHRHEDPTGVSGVGKVAEGCVFSDGQAVTHWLTEARSTVVWDTHDIATAINTIRRIHGHGGKTEIRWLDQEPMDSG